jgi:hypothetical protein
MELCRRQGLDPNAVLPDIYPRVFIDPAAGAVHDAVPGMPPALAPAPPSAGEPGYLPPTFYEALRDGRVVVAEKIYRRVTGAGLKDAARVVREMSQRQR